MLHVSAIAANIYQILNKDEQRKVIENDKRGLCLTSIIILMYVL